MAGKNQTTQTSTNTPNPAVQPILNQGMGDALSLYQNGGLVQPNTMSSVVPFSSQTMRGMQGLQTNARNMMGDLSKSYSSFMSTMGRDGLSQAQRSAMGALKPFTGGSGDISTAGIDRLGTAAQNNPALAGFQSMTGAPQMSMSEQNLSGVASGNLLNGGDANFERALEAATNRATQGVNSLASGMGRMSGLAHQGNLFREIGDLQAGARSQQYNTERDRQVQANQLIDAQRAQGDATRLSALSGLSGTYGTGIGQALGAAQSSAGIAGANQDRRLGAIGSQFNAGQQQLNNLAAAPGVQQDFYSAMNAPYDSMMDIGSMYEGLYGNMLNDRLGIGSQMQNNPYNNLQALLGLAGAGSPYSSQTQTAQGPSSTLSNILGGGLGLASLLKAA